jgi:hypothetical protein
MIYYIHTVYIYIYILYGFVLRLTEVGLYSQENILYEVSELAGYDRQRKSFS